MNRSIQLYIQYTPLTEQDDLSWMEGADGLVVEQDQCEFDRLNDLTVPGLVLRDADPEVWVELQQNKQCVWSSTSGLEATASLRDRWKDLHWMPVLSVYRPSLSYRFSGKAEGEGFSFYIPDTSVIRCWRVTDGEQPLIDAVEHARQLGFDSLWLHSLDAAEAGRGLELEMLDRTESSGLDIWLSGGATESRHLSNLARVGGAAAVVIDHNLAQLSSALELCDCLAPLTEPVIPEVNFSCGQGCAG